MGPRGTIIYTTVGRPQYGFDIFSVPLAPSLTAATAFTERRLTDGVSVNFNGHFLDDTETVAYVSERSGSARLYLNHGGPTPEPLPTIPISLFHDRPSVRKGRLYFVSVHERPAAPFKSSVAVYSLPLAGGYCSPLRLTPPGVADLSPALSRSGEFVAVASYGSRTWAGDFHELETEIVVFPAAEPERRTVVCERGGWPAWAGDSTVFFHRVAADGWWSVFQLNLPENFVGSSGFGEPRRITPPGLHAFTPAASHGGRWIAVATRRPETEFRHVEIFDLQSESFLKVTQQLNPNLHHYNPFFSPELGFLGYHRFRGESDSVESLRVPHLCPLMSPSKDLTLVRLNGNFPSISPDGNFIAFNPDLEPHSGGVSIVRSDGSKRWRLLRGRIAFHTAWSPTELGVVYTSLGHIFDAARSTVQIARITFDPSHLTDDRDEVSSEVKILTREDTGNNAFPSCSPDGKWLVFRSGRSRHKNLYVINAAEGEFGGCGARRLTEGAWTDTMPSWSPDGSSIAFSSNRHLPENPEVFSIYLVRPDGAELRRVHVAGAAGSADVDRERINHVCFSPNSEWVVFTANLGGVSAEPVALPNQFQPYGELFVARVDGSGLQRLTWNAYEDGTPAWHSGGVELDLNGLTFEDSGGDKLTGEFQEPLWISSDF